MTAPDAQKMDFDELMEFEANSPVRHEYIGGRLYERGTSPTPSIARESNYPDIIHNIRVVMNSRLKNGQQGSSDGQTVGFNHSEIRFSPDFLIKCPPFRFHEGDKEALLNLRAVFEVLSPKTESFDRTAKFDQYATNLELSDYILVSADEVRVEHFRKLENGDWAQRVLIGRDAFLRLDNFDISVPLSEIYEDIEIETQPVLPFDDEEPVA